MEKDKTLEENWKDYVNECKQLDPNSPPEFIYDAQEALLDRVVKYIKENSSTYNERMSGKPARYIFQHVLNKLKDNLKT